MIENFFSSVITEREKKRKDGGGKAKERERKRERKKMPSIKKLNNNIIVWIR